MPLPQRIERTVRLSVLALLALAGMLMVSAAAAAPSPTAGPEDADPPELVKAALVGPREIVVRDLPQATATATEHAREVIAPRRFPSDLSTDPPSPAPAANAVDPAFSAGPEPNTPPTPSSAELEGLDSEDNAAITGGVVNPPDPQLAVGPDYIVEMVNIVGLIRSRGGATIQSFSLASFFGVPSGFRDTDPKVIYDALSGRWFASYVAFVNNPGNHNDEGHLYLAISESSDPTGAWNVYLHSYSQVFPDYASIGVTNDKLTVSSNIFDIDQPFYFGEETMVIEKADVLAGAPAASVGLFAFPFNLDRFTVRPAHSLSSVDDQYLVTRSRTSATTLTVIRITGTPDAGDVTEASATNLPITSQTAPPDSQTMGGEAIDSGDERVLDAMWRDGSLWASASAACVPPGDTTTRSCAHLIEVDTTASPPTVAQDIMFGAAGEYFSWPAVRTDPLGDVYVSLTHTNSTIFAEARAAGRLVSEPPNTISGSTLLRAGEAVHTSDRWGDYLAAAVDPNFPQCVWLVGQYAKDITFSPPLTSSDWNWGTYVAVTSYSGGCDSDNDAWTDSAESTIGTYPTLACGTDAWPPDINSNGQVQIDDVTFVAGKFGLSSGEQAYTPRAELASQNGSIQIDDVTAAASGFGDAC